MNTKHAYSSKLVFTLTLFAVGLFYLNSTQNNEFEMMKSEKDAQFLAAALEISLEEIELGTLAAHNAMDANVRILGETMVEAHSQFYNEIQNLATRKGISLCATW